MKQLIAICFSLVVFLGHHAVQGQVNLDSGLVAYWNFNEGTGTVLHDVSGYGNDGTISGANWTTGISEFALNFNGYEDYVEVPEGNIPILSSITITAWINIYGSSGIRQIVERYSDTYSFELMETNNNIWFYNAGLYGNASLANHNWYHVAITFDNDSHIAATFVNGVLDNWGYHWGDMGSGTGELDIGRDPDCFCQYFDGVMDEIRIYNRALSEPEIQSLYNLHAVHVFCLEWTGGSGFTYDGVEPNVGGINTEFEFRVKYRDSEGDAPMDSTYPRLLIDTNGDGTADMTEMMYAMDTTSSFQTGRTYHRFLTLPQSNNIQYKFFAIDSTGDTAQALEQVINWNRGPEIRELDLAIYADDIEFSQENPDTNQFFTVTARVHNESWTTVNNVKVRFYAKPNNYWEGGSRDSSSYLLFGERTLYGIPPWGYAEATLDTFYHVIGFYPFKVRVDGDNNISEWDELNNEAIRPVIVGNYSVPGAIVMASGVSAGNCYATIYGHAEYLGSVVENEVVAGARVRIAIAGESTVDVYTNANGDFSRGFWLNSGNYYVQLNITDFTLSNSASHTFEVGANCGGGGGGGGGGCASPHELAITLNSIQPDQNHQVVIQGTVWNLGSQYEPHVLYRVQVNGSTIWSEDAHIVNGDSVSFGPFYQTLDPTVTSNISASVDPNNAIYECNEGNNYVAQTLYPRDLVVTYDSIGVLNPQDGNGVANDFYVNLYNPGNFYFPAGSGQVQFLLSGVLYANQSCIYPEPHQSVPVLADWTTQLQSRVLKVVADPFWVVSEASESNNQDTIVVPTDLYFGKHSNFPTIVQLGNDVSIPVLVYNPGAMDANSSAILFQDIFRPTGDTTIINTNIIDVSNHRRPYWQSIAISVNKVYDTEGWVIIRITADPENQMVEYNEQNNVWVDSFQVVQLLKPDLRILSQHIHLSDLNPEEGDPVQIFATIYNVGDVQTYDYAQVIFGMDDDIVGETLMIPPLTTWAGGYSYYTLQASENWVAWNPDSAYLHVAKVWVDPWNLIDENDELNNYATRGLIVGSAPDLYVETMDIHFNPLYPHPGDSVTVAVTVHNSGGDEGVGVLKLTCNAYGWSTRDSITVVPFGAFATLEYRLPTPIGGDWTATVHAQVDSVHPYEFESNNNSANRELHLARPVIFPLQTSLNFQFVNPLDSSALTLSVVNAGYDSTLEVDSITVDDPRYSIQLLALDETGLLGDQAGSARFSRVVRFTGIGNSPVDDIDEGGFSLGVGQLRNLAVVFEPDTLGTFPANLSFYSNDPINPVKTVSLTGIGSGPVINAEGIPDSIDFGTIPINVPRVVQISISNEWYGTLDVSLSMSSGDSVFYLFPDDGHLIHNQILNSYLWFMPDTLGIHRDTLRITCNAYNGTLFEIPVVGRDTMFVISDFRVNYLGDDVGLSWEPIRMGWEQYLTWVEAYNLYHSGNPDGPFELLTTLGPTDSTYVHVNPDPNDRHFYNMTYLPSSVLSNLRREIREGVISNPSSNLVIGNYRISFQTSGMLRTER